MGTENPKQLQSELVQKIKEYGLDGPTSAAMLVQAGLGLEGVESALRELGFYAMADKDSDEITVSTEKYEGEVHPRVQRLSLKDESIKHWLSAVE